MEEEQLILRKIKDLEIQGARNVAMEGLRALSIVAKKSSKKGKEQFVGELIEFANAVAELRPTEPMLRNVLRNALERAKRSANVERAKVVVSSYYEEVKKGMARSKELIAQYGASLIEEDYRVLTHCHSSTVTSIFKEAYRQGKNFRVVATETRPKFQGRITAKELTAEGIHTTLVVDNAAHLYLRKADLVLVGADAINSAGSLVNKIGTYPIALIAERFEVPFYSAAELLKFDPITKYGKQEDIERRDKKEVWEEKGIKIDNPAFDLTPSRYISAYITQAGLIPPQLFMSYAKREVLL
ncbi:MAG: S-methyl-5-thioribose-1-phosphate isomerase [Candidatus Anstonellales archaeon]